MPPGGQGGVGGWEEEVWEEGHRMHAPSLPGTEMIVSHCMLDWYQLIESGFERAMVNDVALSYFCLLSEMQWT